MSIYDEDDFHEETNGTVDTAMKRIDKSQVEVRVTITQEQVDGSLNRAIDLAVARLLKPIEKVAAQRIEARIADGIKARCDEVVTALLDREFKPVDEFGNPTGATSTLMAAARKEISSYMTERVDNNGNTYRDSYGRDSQPRRIDWLVGKVAKPELDTAMKEAVAGVTKEARAQVQAIVTRFMTDQLAPTIQGPAKLPSGARA